MNQLVSRIIRGVCNRKPLNPSIPRRFYALYSYNEEFPVGDTCKIHINCPHNVYVKPVVDTAPGLKNKVFIQFNSLVPVDDVDLKVWRENDKLFINSDSKHGKEIKFYIQVPIQSDLHVSTRDSGNINVEQAHGDECILSTENGDIITANCNHVTAELISKTGNIITNGTLKSVDIKMETEESGCIVANHLQAVRTVLQTDEGDMRTQACYCDFSHFKTNTGKLILNNVHKVCNVEINDCGILQMSGFDGTLNVNMKEGEADIQISKLHDQSIINVEEKTPFLLRLSETVMDNTKIETFCPSIAIAKNIKMIKKENTKQNTILIPMAEKYLSSLVVNLEKSHLVVEEASWADMFKLKNRNF